VQRKNNILRNSCSKHRSGFAIIMALTVIVVIGTIMALSIALTTQTTKRTTDMYLYEQAALLSNSAAEYALLRISQAAPCSIPSLNFTHDTMYDINITMEYIFNDPSPCTTAAGDDWFDPNFIVEEDTDGTVLMDITVSVPTSKNVSSEPITFFRRSLQKL
jgi:Tfp pilus assembly protein PilX